MALSVLGNQWTPNSEQSTNCDIGLASERHPETLAVGYRVIEIVWTLAQSQHGWNELLRSFAREPNTFGHSTYEYHADGRVSFVHNLDNAQFDRKYSYDHVGRLKEGLSGTDARGETYDPDGPPPYKQTYTYDVFDNMNGRTNRYWTLEENPFAATYTNDCNTAWVYDDAGNVKNNPGGSYDWDTPGRMRRFNDTFLNQYYDGDGLPALRIENRLNLQDRKTIYYVRSSLLGGQPITELNAQGAKRRTYVYASGQDIARQESAGSNYVVWINRDPITGDDDITRDPLGGYLGNPNDVLFPDYETLKGDAPTHDTDADPFDSGSGCTLDGMPINCSTFASMVNNGAVSVQVGGKILGAVSHVGFGGFWVKQWTPSQPSSADPDPTGPIRLNVTDNAYLDIWIPSRISSEVTVSGVSFKRRAVGLSARGKDENAFDYRARRCGGDTARFSTGQELIGALKDLSITGAIDQVLIHDHGTMNGVIGATQNFVGLYIGNPTNPVYNTVYHFSNGDHAINYADINFAGGAATAEDLAEAIVGGSINIAPNGEFTFFGCNSDALASHLSFILNKRGRGDIGVTGASGSVSEKSGRSWIWDSGWWNSYRWGTWQFNSGKFRSWR